jgi:hypothetical protein
MRNQTNINIGESVRSAITGDEIVVTGFNEYFAKGYLVGSSCLASGNELCGWRGFCIVSYKNIEE